MEPTVEIIANDHVIVTVYKKVWWSKKLKSKKYIWRGLINKRTGQMLFNGSSCDENAEAEVTIRRLAMKT